MIDFLRSYRWGGDNPRLLERQLDFLRRKHGDPGIAGWTLVAPQLEKGAAEKVWPVGGVRFTVKHRGRVDEFERYKVYTEPAHKRIAAYLCGLVDGRQATPVTAKLRDPTRAIMLFYPVRDEVRGERAVSMGFALLFPTNKISTLIRFSVHDPRRPDAVTVSRKVKSKS
jgi:hypothetical protein